ncbi:MAG TPA: homoserine O-succinyltransferase [Bradyrhizobium sp.]|uniref:homoserine O-succinyltransferase MetA n=1 Tax=Bradyrhizobium sp. TaxID=376 RepID=UPI002C1C43CA|nr:homoserine O-succinyltransferase [Bradyrhizobium sp.]HLZ03729.1 homoserine O-succinyltransferase [Bradyrhizobium sp.]
MALTFDKQRPIPSPALAPAQNEFERPTEAELTIALVNNMPDSALKATERQFMRLVQGAAGKRSVRFHYFALPSVRRSKPAKEHIDKEYTEITELDRLHIDGLIVTGAEPIAPRLQQEQYWREFTGLVDWARTNTRSTIWSCLAAHAAVLHLDGVERQRLTQKCSGVYDCAKATSHDWLLDDLPASIKVSHSRLNEVRESELIARGYRILTRSTEAGVDIFARDFDSRFIFFQGHPEYDALSLQREYMRDIARYLGGERETYPAIPASYFDATTEDILVNFERRARNERRGELAAELPGLTLRPSVPAGGAATTIFRNWLDYLSVDARAISSESIRK